jgi:hypothetical protein
MVNWLGDEIWVCVPLTTVPSAAVSVTSHAVTAPWRVHQTSVFVATSVASGTGTSNRSRGAQDRALAGRAKQWTPAASALASSNADLWRMGSTGTQTSCRLPESASNA